jgi:hypothetical protein
MMKRQGIVTDPRVDDLAILEQFDKVAAATHGDVLAVINLVAGTRIDEGPCTTTGMATGFEER